MRIASGNKGDSVETRLAMNSRLLATSLIKVVTFALFLPYLFNLWNVIWYFASYSLKPTDQQQFTKELLIQLGNLILDWALYIVVFLNAAKLSKIMFREDEALVLDGDPYSWALPALQICGLVYLVGAAIGIFPLIQAFREHLGIPDAFANDKSFWKDTWTVFIRLLMGFLLFRNPKWLVKKMQSYSLTDH
jgi:hypothetical protein